MVLSAMANFTQKLDEEIVIVRRAIESLNAELGNRKTELAVLERLKGKMGQDEGSTSNGETRSAPLVQPIERQRGSIIRYVHAAVIAKRVPCTIREVTEKLVSDGVRPNGNAKNFGITIGKALKRLAGTGRIIEEKTDTGRVTYQAKA
jgi:hypothetical protein